MPVQLRRDRRECDASDGQQLRRSYPVYQRLLTNGRPTEWLGHAVFYLASAEYNVGIFIIYSESYNSDNAWLC